MDHPGLESLSDCLERLHSGDTAARAALLSLSYAHLDRLARRMLRGFPRVARWEDASDIRQRALIRLDRQMADHPPPTVRDLLRAAACQIRRELIDMARKYQGPEGLDTNHASVGPACAPSRGCDPRAETPLADPADASLEPSRLASWTEFHRKVESLPDELREVFDLLWYQGLPQAEAATLLGVDVRTVKRRWQGARLRIYEELDGQIPGA